MEEEQDGNGVKLPPAKPKDPEALSKVMERMTLAGAAALTNGPIIPRRRITFDIECTACAPGVFEEDLSITLESLSNAEEMKAVRGISDGGEIATTLARASLIEVNGRQISGPQKEFLWEALGPARQVVIIMYQEIGAATPGAMGKALATSTRS